MTTLSIGTLFIAGLIPAAVIALCLMALIHKAAARSALPEARAWFEQALDVLAALPQGRSAMEQGFDVRLELRPVLSQLGEIRRTQERLSEAQNLAERLDDDRRPRGRSAD